MGLSDYVCTCREGSEDLQQRVWKLILCALGTSIESNICVWVLPVSINWVHFHGCSHLCALICVHLLLLGCILLGKLIFLHYFCCIHLTGFTWCIYLVAFTWFHLLGCNHFVAFFWLHSFGR